MIVGKSPLHDAEGMFELMTLIMEIAAGAFVLGCPEWLQDEDPGAVEFINSLLAPNPKNRTGYGPAGSEDVLGSPFFFGISWKTFRVGEDEPPWVPRPKKKSTSKQAPFEPWPVEASLAAGGGKDDQNGTWVNF